MRKGFIYTLEAVIASSLILSMVVIVLPESGPEVTPDFSTVDSGLKTLEASGSFDENLTVRKVDRKIRPYISESFNHSSKIYKVENNFSTVNAPENVYLNGSGNSSDIQFWVKSASDLNASFEDKDLFTNLNQSGYYETTLPSSEGWLNFTGSGKLDYSFNNYVTYGKVPQRDDVFSKNSLTYYKSAREVQIHIWN